MDARSCLICDGTLPRQPLWPVCSKVCLMILTEALNHKNTPCWISAEVYCRNSHCVSIANGKREECEVFNVERIIRERGLDKEALIGNY